MSFLHGVETVESTKGARVITVVKSGVIGLIGIAPKGALNVPILVSGDADAAQFGSMLPGFTIPQALNAIANQGAGVVIVVNVFDPTINTAQVTDEVLAAVAGRKTKSAFSPLSNIVLKDNTGATTYVLNTDYKVDDFGNILILSNSIAEGALLKFSYKKLDITTVNNTQIVGAIDGTTNVRSGLKCFELAYTLFGFNPKILISPYFSAVTAIVTALAVSAAKYRAVCLADAPAATTPQVALAGRGPAGAINFNTSDPRIILLYCLVKALDGQGVEGLDYYSSYLAGLMAAVDNTEGFHVSPSNHEIKGITGMERLITASLNDPNTEANNLNAAGIVTLFNAFGTGIRAWGNRNASYPSSTKPDNFISIRRTADVIEESIELAQLARLDQPINKATIDSVREDVNLFIRTLVGRGAVVDGSCTYDPNDNPTAELAAGHVTYQYEFMPPPPMERVSFKAFINTNLLKVINAG